MKKTLSLLLTAIMVFSLLPMAVVRDAFADPKLTVTGGTYFYDRHEHTVTVEVTGGSDYIIQYSLDNGANWSLNEPTFVEVGVYYVTVRAYKDDDMLPAQTASLEIKPPPAPAGSVIQIIAHESETKVPAYKTASNATKVGEFTVGETVTLEVQSDKWYKVTNGTLTGYVYYWYIHIVSTPGGGGEVEPADPSAVTIKATGGTFVYDGKEHKVVATLVNGDGYTLEYSTDGGATWTTIAPGITEVGKLTVKVQATSSKGVKKYDKDVVLRILESIPEGTKVKIVKHGSTTSAPLREKASTSSKKLASIPAGTMCSYKDISTDRNWYKIAYGSKVGYVYYWFVDLQDIELKPTITTQPVNQSVIVDTKATFKVIAKASEGTLKYKWKKDGSDIPGATYSSYSIEEAKAEDNGSKYCCEVADANGFVTSREATLKVITSAPTFTKDLSDTVGVVVGKTMKLTVVAEDAEHYQWYYQEPGTTEWINATGTGCQTATYSAKIASTHEGYKFKCKATNALGSTFSREATITLVGAKPKIKTQTKISPSKVIYGDDVTITVSAEGKALSYQWYYKKPGGKFKKCTDTGATTDKLELSSVPYTLSGYSYRCIIKNAKGSVTSKTVKLKVRPKIDTQPSVSNPYDVGDLITLSTVVDPLSGTKIKYQWQYKAPGKKWKSIKGTAAKLATYSFTAKAKHNDYQYRCKITSKQGTIYTDIVTLTINP